MSKRGFAWLLILALLVPMALAACGAPTVEPQPAEPAQTEAPAEPEPTEAEEPEPAVPAVDPSGQTVVFWHVWGTGTVGEGMQALVEEFNATNEWGITVEAVDQGRYRDAEDAMNAAIQSGDLPNIIVGYTNALDTWYSVGVLADINTYIQDPDWGLSEEEIADFYEGAWMNGCLLYTSPSPRD